jgi:putative oxidoreductase
MDRFPGKFSPYFFALLRIVSGLMFAMHGCQKLLAWPGDKPAVEIASLMGVAGIIELVGGILIAVGFLASWAAFLASGEMAVAYFKVHAPNAPLPILNQGELAVVYCFLFLYIAAHGSGIWSIDAMRKPRTID